MISHHPQTCQATTAATAAPSGTHGVLEIARATPELAAAQGPQWKPWPLMTRAG
jgi:hypothetical protein